MFFVFAATKEEADEDDDDKNKLEDELNAATAVCKSISIRYIC